jgi:acetyl esterase/lipase
MIHGGGHTLLSRKDVRPKQTQLLLQKGLLPVSIDYRLCPEVNITDGPMTDVCDALKWARDDLPYLKLGISGLQVDGDKVVVVGWSTGGTLSLTLGFTAPQRGIRPPEAILAFYCPTDYEADFWRQPNYPENSQNSVPEDYDLLEGVQDTPITGYNVDPKKCAAGGWMSLSDPRSRIVLHMNWTGQALPVLLNGLPNKNAIGNANPKQWLQLPQPPEEKVAAITPYAQIKRGNYKTPTYLIHGTKDDLIPWQQMQRTYDALVAEGVPAGLEIVEDAVHLFDLYRDRDGRHWQTVLKGYEFIFRCL